MDYILGDAFACTRILLYACEWWMNDAASFVYILCTCTMPKGGGGLYSWYGMDIKDSTSLESRPSRVCAKKRRITTTKKPESSFPFHWMRALLQAI